MNLGTIAELGAGRRRSRRKSLYARGVIRGLEFPVKILGDGEIGRASRRSPRTRSRRRRKSRSKPPAVRSRLLERTDRWVTARPRSRALPLNRELKRAGFGKVGGPQRARGCHRRSS